MLFKKVPINLHRDSNESCKWEEKASPYIYYYSVIQNESCKGGNSSSINLRDSNESWMEEFLHKPSIRVDRQTCLSILIYYKKFQHLSTK